MQVTLYDRIGGGQTLDSIVSAFYNCVFADPVLAPFFANADKANLRKMMHEFIAVALDGPVHYTGRDLTAAHHGLGISPKELGLFTGHLQEVLSKQLSQQDAYDIITRINQNADAVIGRANVGG